MKVAKVEIAVVSSLIVVLTMASAVVHGQAVEGPTGNNQVEIKTWMIGEDRVSPRTINLHLDNTVNEYEAQIETVSRKRRFRLQLARGFTKTPLRSNINCWFVSLRELVRNDKAGGDFVGHELLAVEGPGIGDSFSKEDRAGTLCPTEPPKRPFDDSLYPMKMRRTFLIEKFKLTVEVTDFSYNPTTNRLEKLSLSIAVRNQT
ncbi:MAG TPA: hypothetical protein VJV05_05220 [Pyrinomonadaceae bacterium]|nr:hypothetical protein [Pyrinomonadaceae bacterium]